MGSIKLKNINEEAIQEPSEEIKAVQEQAMMTEETIKKEKTWEDPAVLSEDEEHINAHSRHYLLNNNTAKSIFSAMPVNYYDEEEKEWKEIDNSLEEKEDGYEAKCGKFTTKVSKAEKGKKVEINGKDLSLSWEYLGKQKTGGEKTFLNAAGMSIEIEGMKAGASSVLQVEKSVKGAVNSKTSRAVYENVEENTDIEYKLQGNNVKENILVKERAEEYKYRFALNTQGLKMRLSEDNTNLELYGETEKENGEKEEKRVFTIPCPYMYDANGENSEEVYYELDPETEGKYLFTVVASAEWINAPERVFPVTIDPQIITNNTQPFYSVTNYDRYRNCGSSSGTNNSWTRRSGTTEMIVGVDTSKEYKCSLYIYKNDILPLYKTVASVILKIKASTVYRGGYFNINSQEVYCGGTGSYLTIDITSRYKNAGGNFTLELLPSNKGYGNGAGDFKFSADGENAPILEIEYITNENVRPTKKEFSLAGRVNGTLNLKTGELVSDFYDTTSDAGLLGVSVSHVLKKSAEDFHVGKNMRLNLHETLKKNTDSQIEANYIYTDASGEKHCFKDLYYYLDEKDRKVYIDKSKVSVNMDGQLSCTDNEGKVQRVEKEQRTSSGLKAITKIEEIKGCDLLEQRQDDIREAEENVKQLKKQKEAYSHNIAAYGWELKKLKLQGDIQELSNKMQRAQCQAEDYRTGNGYDTLEEDYQTLLRRSEQFSRAAQSHTISKDPAKEVLCDVINNPGLPTDSENNTIEKFLKNTEIKTAEDFHKARKVLFKNHGTYIDEDADQNEDIKEVFNYFYNDLINQKKYDIQDITEYSEKKLKVEDVSIKEYLRTRQRDLLSLQETLMRSTYTDNCCSQTQ